MNNFGYAFNWLTLADAIFDDIYKTYSTAPKRLRIEFDPKVDKTFNNNIGYNNPNQDYYSNIHKEKIREYINKIKNKSKGKANTEEKVETTKEEFKPPIDDLTNLSRSKTMEYFRENLKNLSNANLYFLMHSIVIELKNRDKTTADHTTEV